jgi:hypothetical protein
MPAGWQEALTELESVLPLLTPKELAQAKAALTPSNRDRLDSMPYQAVEMEMDAMRAVVERRGIDWTEWRVAYDELVDEQEILPLIPDEWRAHFERMYAANRWDGPFDGPWPQDAPLGPYEYYDPYDGGRRKTVPPPTPEFVAEYRRLYDWLRSNRHRIDISSYDPLLADRRDAYEMYARMPADPRSPFAQDYAGAVRGLMQRYPTAANLIQ